MNSNLLAKHYDGLTPAERYPALIAAHLRGDKLELTRLLRSAPRLVCRSSNVRPLTQAWYCLAMTHLLEMLDFTAQYMRHIVALEEAAAEGNDAFVVQLDAVLEMLAYVLHVEYEGWTQLCAENNLDAHGILHGLPGAETLTKMLAVIADLNPQADSVRALLPADAQGDLITAADCLERWRRRLRKEVDLHGGR